MRLLFSLLLLLSARAAAQDFHHYYDLAGRDDLRDLVVLSPNRLAGIGISRPEGGLESTSLLLLDGAGRVLSAQTLDFPLRTRGMALARQSDSTFWMGVWQTPTGNADDWVIYRVNANTGSVVGNGLGWGSPDTDEQIRAMAATSDGGVIVAGNTGGNNEAIISRLTADGTEVFRRGYAIPGNRFTIFTDVAVLPGGDILAAGGFRPADDDDLEGGYLLARIDPAGNLVWSRRYDLGGELNADGAGLSLELLDDGLIALVGSGTENGSRHALIMLVNDTGELETAFRGDAGTVARDALSVAGQTLLVAGSVYREGFSPMGLVVSFSLGGNAVPRSTFIVNPASGNELRGIRRRPGGGYYLFGQGRLCNDDEDDDALLLSTDDALENHTANCVEHRLPTVGSEFSVTASPDGEMFDRSDPRFAPADLVDRSWTTSEKVCPRADVLFSDLPDPVCYREPVPLIENVTVVSPAGSLTQIWVQLVFSGPGEYLEIVDPPPTVSIAPNEDRTTLYLFVENPGEGADLMEALRGLRYVAAPGTRAGGERFVTLSFLNDCVAGGSATARLNLRFDGNLLANLPTDTILCPGGELRLAVPDLPGSTVIWSTGATTPDLTITEPGTYGITVTNDCGVDATTVEVEERETEILEDETLTLFSCLGDSLPFTAVPEVDVSYAWLDGPAGPGRVFRESSTYELRRTNPCSEAITTVSITFQDCCQLYVPSVFSPNGDGINDVFRAFPDTDMCGTISDFQFRVFDRWGGVVYAGSDPTAGWDGRAGDDAAGNGHFVYSISYFNGLETVRRSGGVVLLR